MPSFDSVVTIPGGGTGALANDAVPAPSEGALARQAEGEAISVRYALGEVLGEGGMGVVRACHDHRIGRDVALKTVRDEHATRGDLVARFLREACVQGQLEHPSIVPVYDLGYDADGRAYFTMKRVRGATFEQIVADLRRGSDRAARSFPRRKLLSAFASVCHALHFAHARGVIHRDLKPGNVMLGDFGEVYVLDWGLAKLRLVADSLDSNHSTGRSADASAVGSHVSGKSLDGATMGTPGYMAPEQARGEPVDARADVYALGAVLFELLALEPLHRPASRDAALASTLLDVDARPGVRSPHLDIPPELDVICARATALDPRDRFGSAGELVAELERFLDGDRDLQRRRELARDHAKVARQNATLALAAGSDATEARSHALGEVGRAMALDPSNSDAQRTLLRLLTDPPREMPPEARAELDREHARDRATLNRSAGFAFLTWFLFVPISFWMGMRSWSAGVLTTGAWMGASAVSFYAARQKRPHSKAPILTLLAGPFAIACTTSLFGPYFLLPGIAAILGMITVIAPADRSRRGLGIIVASLTVVVPAALARTGVLAQPYAFHGDTVIIHAGLLHFPPIPTELLLLLSSLTIVITACLLMARVRDELTAAEQRLHVQAWQLRQLLPQEARMEHDAGAPAAMPVARADERR